MELVRVTRHEDQAELYSMVRRHYRYTGSRAAHLDQALDEFVQVLPKEHRQALVRHQVVAQFMPHWQRFRGIGKTDGLS